MKTSLAWLNTYIDRPAEAQEAIDALTGVGFPEDGVEDVAAGDGDPDKCIDFEVTSNRSDCLSHVGLARELAAATDRRLQAPACAIPEDAPVGKPAAELSRVDNEAQDLCPVYTARLITGVKVGPSPAWLRQRLEAVGLRPVNNVVDVTNFVLLELGQPLHAFDMAKLHERRIVVRRAAKGEAFAAIDGTKHELDDSMLVIADGRKPQAVAGVMGGLDSEVGEATTDILLESARFDPLSVRSTSRRLKLSSDSSYRFERGVDPRGVERASRRAARLILELAGGTLAGGVIRVGEPEPEPSQINMRVERCNQLLGLELSAQEQSEYLARLGLSPVVSKGVVTVKVPTYRLDLQREVDLIEEVARHFGLDRVPLHERITTVTHGRQPTVEARRRLAQVLVAHGFHETITPTLIGRPAAEAFLPKGMSLLNVDEDRRGADPYLRPSILPSLLQCRKLNQDRGNDGVRLFEIGQTFARKKSKQVERTMLALLADAEDAGQALRSLRGAFEELVWALGGDAGYAKLSVSGAKDPRLEPCAALALDGDEIGRLGVLSEALRKEFELQTQAVLLEVDAQALLPLYPPAPKRVELPRFPAIERDLSIVVDEGVAWERVSGIIAKKSPALLVGVTFLTTYRGKPIPKGSKSVSFRMTFRDPGKTLRHDEVDPQVESVVAALKKQVKAELRA